MLVISGMHRPHIIVIYNLVCLFSLNSVTTELFGHSGEEGGILETYTTLLQSESYVVLL